MDAHATHFSREESQSKAEVGRQTTCTQDNKNAYQVGFVAAQENEFNGFWSSECKFGQVF